MKNEKEREMGKKAQNKETPETSEAQNNGLSDKIVEHILQNLSMDDLRPKIVETVAKNLLDELQVEAIAAVVADICHERVISKLMQILIEKLGQ
jgi:hypothetical protein